MCFIIAHTPTRAFQRLRKGESVVETYDELLALQDRLECDIYIALPDEYGQRRVFLYDP
jgi:hypothetical protein